MSEQFFTKVAIISAMEIELYYVEEFLKGRKGWRKVSDYIYEQESKKLQIVTKVLGIGKVSAAYQTADLINERHPDLIINVGYAGGLIKTARTGDVAIGTEYVQVDFLPYRDINRPFIADSPSELVKHLENTAKELEIRAFSGKIATGDFFLHDNKKKAQIIEEHNPIAFDMESAAIAQVATGKQTDFVALRTFSDLADDDAPKAFEDNRVVESDTRIPIEQRPIVLALVTLEKLY